MELWPRCCLSRCLQIAMWWDQSVWHSPLVVAHLIAAAKCRFCASCLWDESHVCQRVPILMCLKIHCVARNWHVKVCWCRCRLHTGWRWCWCSLPLTKTLPGRALRWRHRASPIQHCLPALWPPPPSTLLELPQPPNPCEMHNDKCSVKVKDFGCVCVCALVFVYLYLCVAVCT